MRRRAFPNFVGNVVKLDERQTRLERALQMIGFSPDLPYTLLVNDGTRNRVFIGKINGDYGIKIVDNTGAEVILANGTIVADAIKAGTLDCGVITVANLSADDIVTGTFTADRISGGILDCGTMTVQSLDAGSITVGTFVNINSRLSVQAIHGEKIQVGTLNADRIEALSIKAQQIGSGAVETDKLAADSVTADKIGVTYLSAISANLGSMTAGSITAGMVTAGTLHVDRIPSITADKITVTYLSSISANLGTINAGTLNALTRVGIGMSSGYPFMCYGTFIENNGKLWLGNDLEAGDHNFGSVGSIWAYNYYYRSDLELKKNVSDYKGALAKVDSLRPVMFHFKHEKAKEKKHIGLIAQELEKTFPEIVGKDKKGLKGIRYGELVPVLIKAIQELSREVKLLKKSKEVD